MLPVCVQTIFTHDLNKSVAFYTEGLGYEVAERYGHCIVQLKTNGTPLIIELVAKDQEERTALAFRSENIQVDIERLRASGARVLHDAPQPCPVGWFITFCGPDGVKHELLEFTKNG